VPESSERARTRTHTRTHTLPVIAMVCVSCGRDLANSVMQSVRRAHSKFLIKNIPLKFYLNRQSCIAKGRSQSCSEYCRILL